MTHLAIAAETAKSHVAGRLLEARRGATAAC